MIERSEVDGRPATLIWIADDFEPADDPADATMCKVVFDDGDVAFLAVNLDLGDEQAAADKSFEESKHPRGQPENAGQFGSGGGGKGAARKPAAAAPAKKQAPAPAKAAAKEGGGLAGSNIGAGKPSDRPFYSKHTRVEGDGSVHTHNVYDAARALYEGRKVVLDQVSTVSTLIDHLGQVTKNMVAMGEAAPTFNLCNVSVPGTNLFCAESKGVPRIKMPQLDEEQTKAFRKLLKGKGYAIEKTKVKASELRATQNELLGWKVAKQAAKIAAAGGVMEKRIVVSRDNYILDGHHHWAGQIGYEAGKHGKVGELETKIARVDISITDLLSEALKFTGGKGAKAGDEKPPGMEWPPKPVARVPDGGHTAVLHHAKVDPVQALDDYWDDADWASDAEDEANFEESKHPRGEGGKFAKVAGSGSSSGGEDLPKLEKEVAKLLKQGIAANKIGGWLEPGEKKLLEENYGSLEKAVEAVSAFNAQETNAAAIPLGQKSEETDDPTELAMKKAAAALSVAALSAGLTNEEMNALADKYGSVEAAFTDLHAKGEAEQHAALVNFVAAEKAKSAGLKHYTPPANSQELVAAAQAMVDKPAQKSSTFRWTLNNLIKEVPKFFDPADAYSKNIVAALKLKIAESWNKERLAAYAKGDADLADKIAGKMEKLGWTAEMYDKFGGVPPIKAAPPEAEQTSALKSYADYADAFQAAAQKADAEEMKKLDAKYAVWADKFHKQNPGYPNPAAAAKPKSDLEKFTPAFAAKVKEIEAAHPVSSKISVQKKIIAAVQNGGSAEALAAALKPAEKKKLEKKWGTIENAHAKYTQWYAKKVPAPAKPTEADLQAQVQAQMKASPPTEAELTKAKKNVALQLQYVPGAPQTPEAQKLVDKFNEKYAGKEMADQAALHQKIADFKVMQAQMAPLMSEAQKNASVDAAAQAEANKAAAAAAAEELKKQQAEYAEKNKQYMKDLGISEAEAEGFQGLVKMFSHKPGAGGTADLVEQFKGYANAAKGAGAAKNISGFEAALIKNYKSSSSFINTEMRKAQASWDETHVAYAKVLNSALSKMPKWTGTTTRNTPLDADIQKRYQPGKIVMEHGFTGTSKGSVFSGNTRFHVTGIGKRGGDISQVFGFGGEQEVLYQAHTMFRVDKVKGAIGGHGDASYEVWMTEIEY